MNSKIIGPNYINTLIDGKPHYADSTHPNYAEIKTLLEKNNYAAAQPLFSIPKQIETQSLGRFSVKNGQVYYKNTVIHNVVCDRIIEFVSKKLDINPLCRFLAKLLDNPNPVIVTNLYKYMEAYKLPIDENGRIYAIKAVRNDLKSKWDSSVQYKVGEEYTEPRSLLLSEKQNADYCGPGLWFGWTQFVFNYGSGDDKVILVSVNPKDVIAIPTNNYYQKLAASAIMVEKDLGYIDEVKNQFNFKSNFIPSPVSKPTKQKRDKFGRFAR